MHPSEEQIQRFLHGELDARSREALSLHVAGCDRCAQLLAQAEREEHEIFELLGRLDHATPRVDAKSIARGRGALAVWGRRAAVFVAAAALAGAAYAIPGSPLPAVVAKIAHWIAGEPPAPSDGSGDAPLVTSGIAVPAKPRFVIEFVAQQASGVAVLSLADGPNVVVRALGGTATFTTDIDRLTVDNRGSSADYEIEIPRSVSYFEVSIGARRAVIKDGEAFATGFPLDEHGRAVLPLAAPKE
jgi:hypothetical protein